ncbi:MAG: secreted protein, partial [Frankiales bacterium]|nr:secreted protein [Frankiales bacterium]
MATATVPAAATANGGWVRRQRSSLVIGGGLVLAVAIVILVGGGAGRTTAPLDPDNPDPAGGRAVARVLADQGVDVTVVRSADALDDATVDADTTVLVTSTDLLGESTIDRLLDHTGEADLVLAEPGPGTTEAFGIEELPFQVTVDHPRPAACANPTYDGLSLQVDRALEYPVAGGCFRGQHGALLTEPKPGIEVLGAGDVLSNDQVLRADNAAVALRLLGQHDRLVWYVPSLDDLVGDDGVSLTTLLPRQVRPGLWIGGLAVLALLLWRVRRLGPLSTEPLPVVVKAIETTRSRGRLYRKAGDRGHAAAHLRS